MGLLDGFFGSSMDDPKTQAILALGAGLLSGRGNFGQVLGQAVPGAVGAYQMGQDRIAQGRQRQMQERMLQTQLAQLEAQQAQQQTDRQLMQDFALPRFQPGASIMKPGSMDQGPMPFNPLEFVQRGGSPQGAMTMAGLQPKRPEPMKVGKDDRVVVPDGKGGMREILGAAPGETWETVGNTPAGQILQRNNRGELRAVGSGPLVQNNVNTAKPFLNELAGGLGKQVEASSAAARAAVGSISTAQRLLEALDSPQGVVAGPGATARVFGMQLGQLMGVSGKDAQERLTNTRQAIQAMAQLELDAAQQMKGQGQITEAERDIIRRAAAGNIDTFTVPELRLLATTIDKVARSRITSYQQNVRSLGSMPGAEQLLPFMNVEMPPPYSPRTQQGGVIDFNQLPPGR